MSINILKRSLLIISLFVSGVSAQDKVDAIEAARQAKAAAEKAAADAEAATDAAIEQAAKNAAKDAREKIKQDRLEKEARKIAEAKAAEEAELDAAASAAAEEAKRKMAEELGLEYESPETTTGETASEDVSVSVSDSASAVEDVELKELTGWNVGAAASIGLLSGNSFTSVPAGVTVVVSTPVSFDVGPFNYTVSLALGGYTGSYDSSKDDDYSLPVGQSHFTNDFNPTLIAIGGNLTLAQFVFAEGHLGKVGNGLGFRGFAGITLEKVLNKGLNLPFNLLVGSESFYSTNIAGSGNSSGWASLGVRLDYNF